MNFCRGLSPGIDADMTFHYTRFIFKAIALVVVCFSVCAARAQQNSSVIDNKIKELSKVDSPSDSIKILLDVYSLSDKMSRDNVRKQIINLTQRSDNKEVITDVLGELATSTDDADQLSRLIEISQNMPKSQKKKNLQTVLMMEQAKAEAPDKHDSDIEKEVVQSARLGFNVGDPYKEIQNIYRAMMYLGESSQGPLYLEYVKRLDELISQLPDEDYAIKNLFYTTAAIFYTRKRDYKSAIDYDRRLIKELDEMKRQYAKDGDTTHNLDFFYYVSYRRMLRNFMGLTPAEIENIYAECVRLAKENEEVNEAFGTGGLTKSYYYVATKQFAKAVPELRKALEDPDISRFRRQELLGLLAWALNNTGDKNAELIALREYTNMMMEDMEIRRENTYKEIELRNSVNKMINDEYLEQEQIHNDNRVMRKTSLTLVYVLALIIIFITQAYFRLRHKVKVLELKNNKLHKNIEYIFDDGVPKGSRQLKHRLKG